MASALLDPWLTEFSADRTPDNIAKIASLRTFADECQERGIVPLEFLPPQAFDELLGKTVRMLGQHQDGRLVRILKSLTLKGPHYPFLLPAFRDSPVPDLPGDWKVSLGVALEREDEGKWRDPIVAIPACRRDSWPQRPEIRFTLGPRVCERLLAIVGEFDAHCLLNSDLDPWLYRAPPDPEARRRLCAEGKFPSCLPRHPRLPSDLPMGQWVERLHEIRDWTYMVNGEVRYYYLPPWEWNPLSVTRDEWRKFKCFPRESKTGKGGQLGLLDRFGQTWICHVEGGAAHWDVQESGEKSEGYAKISHDGRLIA
jgi:hypothetical protein